METSSVDDMRPRDSAMVLTPVPPAGGAALAVVRLHGNGVDRLLARYFSKRALPGRCVHGELRDKGVAFDSDRHEISEAVNMGTDSFMSDRSMSDPCAAGPVIDDPVVVLSQDRTWADISLHGGAWIVASVLELAEGEGFAVDRRSGGDPNGDAGGLTPAACPYPSLIAFAECESILEREMLSQVPLARTELALRTLLAQAGNWRNALWKERALNAAAVVADRSLWWLLHPPQVAIVGAPNVGKSTLANQLFGQERSITADLPGTTRDWVGAIANVNGLALELVDTPGLRQTDDAIERAAIAHGVDKIESSDLVIHVLDATIPPDRIRLPTGNQIVVINKIDLQPAWDFSGIDALCVSARCGKGLTELRARICGFFGVDAKDNDRPRWWTERQREVLLRAVDDPGTIGEIAE